MCVCVGGIGAPNLYDLLALTVGEHLHTDARAAGTVLADVDTLFVVAVLVLIDVIGGGGVGWWLLLQLLLL